MEPDTPRKKAIILTAVAGQGHLSAAYAFDYWLSEFGYNTQILDVVPTVGEDSYKILVKSPRAWKALFEISNSETISKPFIRRLSKIMEKRLIKISPGYSDADIIISTYFMIHPTRGKNQAIVLLDPMVHAAYITEQSGSYYIAFWEQSLKEVQRKQPDLRNKTFLTGPVVRSNFYSHARLLNKNGKAYFKNLLGIPLDHKLILITAGGNWIDKSSGCVDEFYSQFQSEKVILVFVCGKNIKFQEKMMQKYPLYNKFIFLPWLNGDQIATWMCAADYGVSFTLAQMIAEAGLSKMPLFVYNFIPGQEESYKDIVENKDVGKYINADPKTQVSIMKKMISDVNTFDLDRITDWQEYLLQAPDKLKEVIEKITNLN